MKVQSTRQSVRRRMIGQKRKKVRGRRRARREVRAAMQKMKFTTNPRRKRSGYMRKRYESNQLPAKIVKMTCPKCKEKTDKFNLWGARTKFCMQCGSGLPAITKRHKPATKYHRKPWKMVASWHKNPGGIIGQIKGVMKPPTFGMIKAQPVAAFGVGLLGVIDTGLIGMAIDYATTKQPEWQQDACRIVGKIGFGTMMSYATTKISKKPAYGQYHQLGVYINTGLDIVGTLAKHYLKSKQPKEKLANKEEDKPAVTQGFISPMVPTNMIANVFGFQQILNAVGQAKLNAALSTGGIKVMESNGEIALAAVSTGNIIVSGPADAMKPVLSAVKNGIGKDYNWINETGSK